MLTSNAFSQSARAVVGAVVEIGAGDVDQEIEAAVPLDGRRDQRGDVGVAGDVGADEARLVADAVGDALAVGLVDVGDDDIDAVAGEHRGAALADQRRAAGNDRGLSVQPLHAQPPVPASPGG